jgi:sulfur relay protein TusB/DsrH
MTPLIQIFCYPGTDWLETVDIEAVYLFLNEGICWLHDTHQNQEALAPFLKTNTPLYILEGDLKAEGLLPGIRVISLEDWVNLTITHNPLVSY